MKSRPLARKFFKWVTTLGCLLCIAAWWWSGQHRFRCTIQSTQFSILEGRIELSTFNVDNSGFIPVWWINPAIEVGYFRWDSYLFREGDQYRNALALWVPSITLLIACGILWWQDMRRRTSERAVRFPKLRRSAKWGLTTIALCIAIAWIVSYQWLIGLADSRASGVFIWRGTITAGEIWTSKWDLAGWTVARNPDDRWTFLTNPARLSAWKPLQIGKGLSCASTPMWVPLLLVVGGASALWLRDVSFSRRKRLGHCTTCSYDRKGLETAALCPECGSPATLQV